MDFPALRYTRESNPPSATTEQQERYNAMIDDILQYAPMATPHHPIETLRLLHAEYAALDNRLIRQGSLRAPLRRVLARGLQGEAVNCHIRADKGWENTGRSKSNARIIPLSLGKVTMSEGFSLHQQEAAIYGTSTELEASHVLSLTRTQAVGVITVADQVFNFSPEHPNITVDLLTVGPGFLQNGEKYHYWPASGQFDAFRTLLSPLYGAFEDEEGYHESFEYRLQSLQYALNDVGVEHF